MAAVDFTQDVANGGFGENGQKATENGKAGAGKVQLLFISRIFQNGPQVEPKFGLHPVWEGHVDDFCT